MTEWRPMPVPDGEVRHGCSCCCWFPLLAILAAVAGLILAVILA
jgi:hypothetical protein